MLSKSDQILILNRDQSPDQSHEPTIKPARLSLTIIYHHLQGSLSVITVCPCCDCSCHQSGGVHRRSAG